MPPGENLELWKVTVRNKSEQRKQPKLFSFVEFCFFEALNDMTNLPAHLLDRRGRDRGRRDLPQDRVPRAPGPLHACSPARARSTASTPRRDAFVGMHEGLHDPKAPFAGQCTNSNAFGWNPIGAHQINLDLAPGQEETFAFILAYVEQGDAPKFDAPFVMNKKKGRAIVDKYSEPGAVDAAFAELGTAGSDLLVELPGRMPRPSTPTAWSIPGTSTSAWRRSTCAARPACTKPASAAAWVSATPTRTCSASCT